MTQLPTILNLSDIDRNFPDPFESEDSDERDKREEATEKGKQVRVIGKYTQVEVRQRPEWPPVYKGHVSLILAEGTEVFLYPTWRPEAIRSAQEIARYNNQLVVVVGKFVPRSPQSPNGAAHPIGPCMLTIDSIEFWTQE